MGIKNKLKYQWLKKNLIYLRRLIQDKKSTNFQYW